MKNATLQTRVWQLIYGGAASLIVGQWAGEAMPVLGQWLSAVGLIAVVAGLVGIWWRSRRSDDA